MNAISNFIGGFENFISDTVNDFVWQYVAIALLIAGIYFGIRTGFVQFRMIKEMFRTVVERTDPNSRDKDISPFKAFSISAASRVGTGNIVGVAIAISWGGPGAVFWMWAVALVGGATSFVESTLAQLWKTKDADGFRGGPAYYMTRGLRAPWLAAIFGFLIVVTYGLVYNAVQTNSIVAAIETSINEINGTHGHPGIGVALVVGALIAAVTALIIFGGVQRIANVTQIMVPFMALIYIVIGIVVLAMNLPAIPGMFADIVGHALGFKQITGAAIGQAFIQGMRRGLFSNEAGQGSAPNAAATANVSHPAKQGLVQTLGVYFDTIVVCSITAFIILLSDPTFGKEPDPALTQTALADQIGSVGIHLVTIVLFFLAFSSVLGNYYLAQANLQYFTTSRAALNGFRIAVVLCVFGGAIGTVPLVWSLADTFAASMVITNLIAIIPLGGVAYALLRNYTKQKKQGLEPVFNREDIPGLRNVEVWDGSEPITTREYWDNLAAEKNKQ